MTSPPLAGFLGRLSASVQNSVINVVYPDALSGDANVGSERRRAERAENAAKGSGGGQKANGEAVGKPWSALTNSSHDEFFP